MYQDFQLYIDGEWAAAKSGATKQVFDPANEDEIGKISDAGSEDLDRALAAAEAALPSGAGPARGNGLRRSARSPT